MQNYYFEPSRTFEPPLLLWLHWSKQKLCSAFFKGVMVHPQKLALELSELEEFHPCSQIRKEWLRELC